MPVVSPIPAQTSFGLAPGPTPFNRKDWDNPIKYKLNRAYGDEFEYTSFRDLSRRWQMAGATLPVAADFGFPGGSAIEWYPLSGANTGASTAIQIAAPSGDFEAVLEYSQGWPSAVGAAGQILGPAIGLVDSTGVGAAGGMYLFNALMYTTTTTSNLVTTATNNTVNPSISNFDGRHFWIGVRRTGTTLTGRMSHNGITWSSFTAGVTVSATAPYLCIAKCNVSASTEAGMLTLYRLNVYPGPAFF
jgi:hypothetical protein